MPKVTAIPIEEEKEEEKTENDEKQIQDIESVPTDSSTKSMEEYGKKKVIRDLVKCDDCGKFLSEKTKKYYHTNCGREKPVRKKKDTKEVKTSVELAPVEKQPVELAPVEKPPVEKPPVELAPVEKPPVEKPPVEKQPVELAPVKQPVEKPPEKQKTFDELRRERYHDISKKRDTNIKCMFKKMVG